jgi:hypothetical protein
MILNGLLALRIPWSSRGQSRAATDNEDRGEDAIYIVQHYHRSVHLINRPIARQCTSDTSPFGIYLSHLIP